MIHSIRAAVQDAVALQNTFFRENETLLAEVAGEILKAFRRGNKVVLFGNGGSAADAQHIAAEWVGRFQKERSPLPAIALTTDTSILTAVGNDYGFDQIFVRQLQALGRPGDIALAISASGLSPNVLRAAEEAARMGMVTVGLTGKDGGKLGAVVRYHLNVRHDVVARIQEVHTMIGHLLCQLTE